MKWLQSERGISEDALKKYGVTADGDEIVFPYPEGEKRRVFRDGVRRFYFTPGVVPGIFGGRCTSEVCYLTEGETDALRLYSELPEKVRDRVDIRGLSGIETWRSELAEGFSSAKEVYVILDNDEDYNVQARVDAAWRSIRKDLGRRARRVKLPSGSVHIKDVCDYFDVFDWEDFVSLTESEGQYHYEALDLLQPPKKPDWLIYELVCKGDLTMMIGEPGVGKSWLTMALAVAVAEGKREWLGRPVMPLESNRVLYVDEENPELLVPYRLRKLGLTDEGVQNIRYLHRQGIRLDRSPEDLLDEALEWNPSLIILDSLTRLHTKDENNAGEVSALFNDGIVPLARESGACTLILHHVNKSDSNSAFNRARGSGDISASIDTGLDIRNTDGGGFFSLTLYKSRWIEEGARINGRRMDVSDTETVILGKERGFAF